MKKTTFEVSLSEKRICLNFPPKLFSAIWKSSESFSCYWDISRNIGFEFFWCEFEKWFFLKKVIWKWQKWFLKYESRWRKIFTYDKKTSVNLFKMDFSNDALTFNFGWYVDTQKYHKGRDNHSKPHPTKGEIKSLTQGDKFGLLEFQDNSESHNGPPQKFSILIRSRTSYH